MASCRRSENGAKGLSALLFVFSLCSVLAFPSQVLAEALPIRHTAQHRSYDAYVSEASRRFRIPAAWIRAVMRRESGNDPRAISPKGAMGLMQIMPDTWNELRTRYRLGEDPFDPRDNILAGAAYLRELYDRYGSPSFLAAYNAGPRRYEDSLSKTRHLPAETRAYVAALLPLLDGDTQPDPVVVATALLQTPPHTSLFVALGSQQSNDSVMQSGASVDSAVIQSLRNMSGIAPLSDGLFVASIIHRGQ